MTNMSRPKTETPGQYDRRQRAREHARIRQAIDRATTSATPVVAKGDAVHPRELASISDDAIVEGRASDSAATLAQISAFRVGRSTYRVIAERMVDKFGTASVTGDGQVIPGRDYRTGQIALVCRTRASTLYQHVGCVCAVCVKCDPENAGADPATGERRHGRVWWHDATRTYHLRADDGTLTQIPASEGIE